MRKLLLLAVTLGCSHAARPPDAAPALPAADLVSPITAAGTETPRGGGRGPAPAASLFKNVPTLGAVSGDRFIAGMQSMRPSLGQKCNACHKLPDDFASDEKEPKLRARQMIAMNAQINAQTFGGHVAVTCWMCHRGEAPPQPVKFDAPPGAPSLPGLTEADLARPAGEVFKDLRVLPKGMPAARVGAIMGRFSQALGVKCTHCHVEGDFAADKQEKTRAREMLAMTSGVAKAFYEGKNSPVSCATCHRGRARPERLPAPAQ